jgi:hypothetical protein
VHDSSRTRGFREWDTIEYAAGYRARLAAIPDFEIAHHCWRCGWEDADTEALELDRHKRVLADGGEDAYAETWGLLFDAGGDAWANGVPSMRAVRTPGKKAGSPRTSMLGWQALKTNPSKTGVQRALHCRCGREKILALGLCATCYTLKRQDDEYFSGVARAGSGARWLLPCLRCFGSTQTFHRCSSSRTRKILTPSYDFALPWVSCESGSHKSRSFTDATASARIVARTTPAWP